MERTLIERFIDSLNDEERLEAIERIIGNADLKIYDWDNNVCYESDEIYSVNLNGPGVQITINNPKGDINLC